MAGREFDEWLYLSDDRGAMGDLLHVKVRDLSDEGTEETRRRCGGFSGLSRDSATSANLPK